VVVVELIRVVQKSNQGSAGNGNEAQKSGCKLTKDGNILKIVLAMLTAETPLVFLTVIV